MDINLKDLFEVQRKLDAEIEKKHPVGPGEDRFAKKKLALLVEIGELANEVRTWKFWSANQKPNTYSINPIFGTEEDGTPYQSYEETNPLLEEFVDCIHFLLSIGNEYAKFVSDFFKEYDTDFRENDDFNNEHLPGQFNAIFRYASKLGGGHNEEFDEELDLECYYHVFMLFLGLGEMLGFTEKQVVDAYMSKNQINYERQANGY